MASQEDITPGNQPVQVVVAQKAMVKANAGKGIKRKMNRNRTLTSTGTANGPQSQVTVKTKKKKTKKQKKAEKEAAEASSAQPATQVTETEETAEIAEITAATAAAEITEITTETGLLVRDEISTPSAASGGVPEPTASYLRRAHLAPSRLSSPRRILIVMDLNGTLLHRPSKRRASHFIARPHARIFMDYLLSTFSVAVWSSARPHNVQAMVASLLTPAQRQRCLVVWGREHMGLSSADYDARVQCYKRLARVWGDRCVMAAHPDAQGGGRGRWDQSNTVLVDDSAEKARSEPHNLLRIPEYLGPEAESQHVLPQVHDYINELAWQADISQYIRENPFKLDASYKL
ncbi:NIF domain protein [Beauveria brongniartii RCEF 3172]|uniref:Mitochondrial import inner membrane translocase subunit TIM50 n=1 Tax=Beauveria brongniartii RCEF 3172 TaxID=1081107 RepID=A0A162JPX1_9HYPO|nr:NIF domain protein [Beauveria brongniartii RCEF 3172]